MWTAPSTPVHGEGAGAAHGSVRLYHVLKIIESKQFHFQQVAS